MVKQQSLGQLRIEMLADPILKFGRTNRIKSGLHQHSIEQRHVAVPITSEAISVSSLSKASRDRMHWASAGLQWSSAVRSQHALLASTRPCQHARPQERDGRERSTRAGGERHLDVPDARQYDRATNNVVREEGFRRGRERPREHDGFVQPRLLRTRRFEQPVQPGRVARHDKSTIAVERLGILLGLILLSSELRTRRGQWFH